VQITELLKQAIKSKASDLHLSTGVPPILRIDGDLERMDLPELESKTAFELIHAVMSEDQKKHYKDQLEIDFSFEIPEVSRFRVNAFMQRLGPAAVFRCIPSDVVTLEEIHAPVIFKEICNTNKGLVLVTGPTGSGKSTTLAAMIEYINNDRADHIVTIEDPIEFVHKSKRSLINQREVFRDTHAFEVALRSALREDPDVILVGEMRDLETIRLALTAAETGHLVFATVHTSSAAKTIDRVIDVFPGDEKSMVRGMLSESLKSVISQTLVKRLDGGRIGAFEIMLCTPAIRNLIREGKVAQMYSTIQTGRGVGMQTLDQHLQELASMKLISPQEAKRVAESKEIFNLKEGNVAQK